MESNKPDDIDVRFLQALADDKRQIEASEAACRSISSMEQRIRRLRAERGIDTLTGLVAAGFREGWLK